MLLDSLQHLELYFHSDFLLFCLGRMGKYLLGLFFPNGQMDFEDFKAIKYGKKKKKEFLKSGNGQDTCLVV